MGNYFFDENFYSLKGGQILIEQWRKHYNSIRPHSSLNYRLPAPEAILALPDQLKEQSSGEKSAFHLPKGGPIVGGRSRCFSSGAFRNISNAKIKIFCFAYLPPLLNTSYHSHTDLLLLGNLFAVLTLIVKGSIGYLNGKLPIWILNNGFFLKWLSRASGAVFIFHGVKLALEEKQIT